jgi:hypothetical protein
MEQDFWARADPASSLFNWKFPDAPDTAVFVSEAVHTGAEAVTFVFRDAEDGAWQFLGDSMTGGGEPVTCCFHHPGARAAIDKNPTLKKLADLPLGWSDERAGLGKPWVRHKHEPDRSKSVS